MVLPMTNQPISGRDLEPDESARGAELKKALDEAIKAQLQHEEEELQRMVDGDDVTQ